MIHLRSIRGQLILWLVSGILILTVIVGIGLYTYMEEVLERQLDAALTAKSGEIARAVQIEEDGQPRLRPPANAAFADPHPRRDGQFYYEIRTMEGRLIDRLIPPDQANAALPRISKPHRRYAYAHLSSGMSVRITEAVFTPQPDDDDPPHAPVFHAAPLLLIVAHDTQSIDIPLAILLSGLVLCAALLIAGLIITVAIGVRRGLRPLMSMSTMVDRVGPESLDLRIANLRQLPTELQPIGAKLNDLLDRLSAAFARERRFSAAVAHELRTPLAELQSACDVALRWPDDSDGLTTALSEARDVALQMSTMVQSLLLLARAKNIERLPVEKHPVRLQEAIAEASPQMLVAAGNRSVKVSIELAEDMKVLTNRAMLIAILRNLLDNAVEYTPEHGAICLRTKEGDDGTCSLQIENTCLGVTADDVPRLAEPFWRKDLSRTGHHTGLGLTLVQHYCDLCGLLFSLRMPAIDRISVEISFPGASHRIIAA